MMALLAMATVAAGEPPETVRFITCPTYRDTDAGRKSGCWLADDRATGRRYDVSAAPSKPDWNHEILVEGKAADAPDRCGGIVLDPVRTSVLAGTCTRHMLPAEGYPGNRFSLPKRNVAPMAAARAVPPGPYSTRTFRLFFGFDSAFLMYQYDDYLLDRAITWIRAAKPRTIVVTGYAASGPEMVSGRAIAEDEDIARDRGAGPARDRPRDHQRQDRYAAATGRRPRCRRAGGCVAPSRRYRGTLLIEPDGRAIAHNGQQSMSK
jgi:hypothetical protein